MLRCVIRTCPRTALAVAMFHSALSVTCIRGIKVRGTAHKCVRRILSDPKLPVRMGKPTIAPHAERPSVSQLKPIASVTARTHLPSEFANGSLWSRVNTVAEVTCKYCEHVAQARAGWSWPQCRRYSCQYTLDTVSRPTSPFSALHNSICQWGTSS